MEYVGWYVGMGLLGGMAIALVWVVRRETRQRAAALQTVQNDLRALCNASMAMGERVRQAERQLQQLAEQQKAFGARQEELQRVDETGHGYEQAIKLAQKGASVDDLMDVCGLTRGEAELVAMVHRLGKV